MESEQKELDRLEEFYSALTPAELEEDEPAVGLPCVVKYLEDGLYYRSRITSIDGDTAEVLFVDYGNSQKTPLNELKRIHPEFMKFPQLVSCNSFPNFILLFIMKNDLFRRGNAD